MLFSDRFRRLRWCQEVHCLWAAQQQAEGAFEAAAAGFLAGDRPAAAVTAIARRSGIDALQVPCVFRDTVGVAIAQLQTLNLRPQTSLDPVLNLVP